ncbi:hypothetical protein [uncultured Turicimonas sp.]|uniref:hypothetical protein n=1 Tax=uncultured Turicimonas sp. TaxID=1918607 RepID=UPI0028055E04|nr:hypothetical protein [uncultured Turicimonas sp.]
MKGFKLVAVSLAAALAFGSTAFAQQAQAPISAPQAEAPAAQSANQFENANQFGPAAVVINKLVTMQNSGKFLVTQEELDKATEFLMNKAKAEGVEVTRDEALVGMGYIAGSLATFMDIQKQAAEMVPQAVTPLPPEVMPAPSVEPQTAQPAPQVQPSEQAPQVQQPSQMQIAPQPLPQEEILVPVQPGQFQQGAPSAQNAPSAQQ